MLMKAKSEANVDEKERLLERALQVRWPLPSSILATPSYS